MDDLATKTAHISVNDPSKETAQETAHDTATSFSPVVLSHLERIYSALATSKPEFLASIQHESNAQHLDDPLASLAHFHAYMASPASSALSPATKPQFSAPMNDYYISSSHNTYLTGNQLYSDSDADSYAAVCLHLSHCSSFWRKTVGLFEMQQISQIVMLT